MAEMKRKLTPPPPRNTGVQEPRREKARGEHQPPNCIYHVNDNGGVLVTMGCWDCQIEPHLAALLVWHPLEEDTSIKALMMILTSSALSPPLLYSLRGEEGGGRGSNLITHLVIDVTVNRAFP